MELPAYDLKTLFDQLGLPSEGSAIDDFIGAHPLDPGTKLIDADFWTPQQAQLLKEWLRADGEEAVMVDELNVRLHDGQ
ncbi:DUF2789 domain-containing protein [Pseudomonas sp. B2M1-30]|uniref:DUF2789 domain-containing protein n=1 Tax=Pseudomonas koreensis TaxID=198620 RepID=A0A9X2XI81_9PSED|nr:MULTISPECIES: DUF2789 family protein [Pseudomonas]MBV4476987.1 DUF2789 domain-containing protein [Pseudomonas botevensis]MCU0119972.1 DUF2789 domain-containing protein [Pseudomonas sp. B2M1-30]MCU7249729.1 DUF2789 domain-containing protein [Pseudomonas koreensis]MCU7261983.1 DUF2789 domain-containing protein [Pseudomonas koreensis]